MISALRVLRSSTAVLIHQLLLDVLVRWNSRWLKSQESIPNPKFPHLKLITVSRTEKMHGKGDSLPDESESNKKLSPNQLVDSNSEVTFAEPS